MSSPLVGLVRRPREVSSPQAAQCEAVLAQASSTSKDSNQAYAADSEERIEVFNAMAASAGDVAVGHSVISCHSELMYGAGVVRKCIVQQRMVGRIMRSNSMVIIFTG